MRGIYALCTQRGKNPTVFWDSKINVNNPEKFEFVGRFEYNIAKLIIFYTRLGKYAWRDLFSVGFSTDYDEISVVFMFEACTTRVCEALSIVDDDVSERTESFYLTLERTNDLDSRIILNPSDGEVTILNDDGK